MGGAASIQIIRRDRRRCDGLGTLFRRVLAGRRCRAPPPLAARSRRCDSVARVCLAGSTGAGTRLRPSLDNERIVIAAGKKERIVSTNRSNLVLMVKQTAVNYVFDHIRSVIPKELEEVSKSGNLIIEPVGAIIYNDVKFLILYCSHKLVHLGLVS